MIVDRIKNIGRYGKLIKDADKLEAFFQKASLDSLAAGQKITVEGTGYSFGPYEFETQPSAEKRWEIHRDHIDIHIVLQGKEAIEWIPVSSLKNSAEYIADTDVEFFSDTTVGSLILVDAGFFVICLPEDAHKPSVKAEGYTGKKTLIKADALKN
ncbi:hypothetical protein AGMMS49928_08740 [Spirochaetia bacterium]|nr:hypothetical protein AGMMS49928_08740 [Spirochaetia bacterium]